MYGKLERSETADSLIKRLLTVGVERSWDDKELVS